MFILENFVIKPLELEDTNSLNDLLLSNSERFQRYFPKTLEENKNIKETQEYILRKKDLFHGKNEFTLALKDVKSKIVAGLVIIKNINLENKNGEVAYCIGTDFEGKGWMTQAVKELTLFAFDELELDSVYILVHKSNIPSVRVAQKAGFIWTKTVINGHTPPNENPIDMEYYELKK